MAEAYDGNAQLARAGWVRAVARALDVRTDDLKQDERRAFENFARALALIDGLDQWAGEEKKNLIEIIRAKAGVREADYARLMQNHEKLRDWLRRLVP